MATQACLNNIQKKTPPKYCGDPYCGAIQVDINEYCQHTGIGGDVPVPQNPESGKCWCCCSCMAWGTPIETSEGNYRLIETIVTGDTVLSTGGKMDAWVPREVTGVGGIAPGVPIDICYTAKFLLADGAERTMVSTADHLYLIPGCKLSPVQDLRPGDKVVQADGKEAVVTLVAFGQFSGGVRNFAMGDYDPKEHPGDPYKGHLMNTFGLVTADLALQMAFYQNEFGDDLLARKGEDIRHIGTPGFFAKYDTAAYEAFVADPQQWPKGFKPAAKSLINIPASALRYFTDEQAHDIAEHEVAQNPSNSEAMADFKYLKKLMRGFYPNYYYIADWARSEPNAWFFNDLDQSYIVVSGGLMRLSTMNIPGLSMVFCHMLAQAGGKTCTGDADYWGAALWFREIWYDDLFFEMFDKARPEVEATFALVSPDHAKEDPNNICARPSLECRLTAIKNGGTFSGVPQCAVPPPDFTVMGATAPTLTDVRVTFSAKTLVATAVDPEHYKIAGGKVTKAEIDATETVVTLTVNGLQAATHYTVRVQGVLSARGQTIAKDHNTAQFVTL
ncbi:fibronectin type III domain-containing protein [Bradyrhizobium sp. CCBAU 53380]|uniref:fibronectin type III domain-containing protein n=1 Tax=Bradyrhizobium sp. CCBAU 53380 TaxID=1325117 RepID=UPI002302C582|nr:hypothetical protein [Bradyrhizobium sp. CCBAU 53380]MDA9421113.1 hypothetical protein [Bradyrhizobium sp. CCBAU 53380]